MNKLFSQTIFSIILFVSSINFAIGQDCTTNGTSYDFFSGCTGQTAVPGTGDYHIKVKNGQTIYINGDLTINGTLTIQLVGSTSKVVVESPFTLSATNLTFDGSATGKQFEVQSGATVDVSGTLDFGGMTIEVDGEGTINADVITGGDNVTCDDGSGVPATDNCPSITANTCADPGGLCTEGTVTPIVLASFDVQSNQKSVNVNWATTTEENNDYFTIERSADGQNFHELTVVSGAGNSSELLEYSYTDNNPFEGVSYYRLKQTDYDGTSETFKVVAAEFYGKSEAIKVIQQIDKANELKIFSNLDEENIATIYDLMGRATAVFKLHQGENSINLESVSKQSGVHMIRITNALGKALKSSRIIIQ